MRQLVQLNEAYDEIRGRGAELLVVHLECGVEGTRLITEQRGFRFPMANDEALAMALPYSPTTTYLIDGEGRIAARWLDRIHDRATPKKILAALDELAAEGV